MDMTLTLDEVYALAVDRLTEAGASPANAASVARSTWRVCGRGGRTCINLAG